MRPRFLLLPALLLCAPLAAGDAPGVSTSAAGTATLLVTDAWTGATRCVGTAAVAVEVDPLAGVVAWESPCGEGAQAYRWWCTDACFHDCWTWEDVLTCERDGTTLTLARDGAFALTRWAAEGDAIELRGKLLVASWAEGF